MTISWSAPPAPESPKSAADRRREHPEPAIPAACPACFALLDPTGQRIANVVKRLLRGAPLDCQWHRPARTPLCQRENGEEPR